MCEKSAKAAYVLHVNPINRLESDLVGNLRPPRPKLRQEETLIVTSAPAA